MQNPISRPERIRLAEKAGVSEQTLYQALTGRGGFTAKECVRIEGALENELRRWDLRPKDWHLNWPELIGTEGAPPVPEEQGA
jgi:DNA-binding transcriptional regulator YdaS (Cro superfamily)